MHDTKGLYTKYIITKADGTPVNDRCFILKPDKDPAAVAALHAYAAATDDEQLRNDLYAWIGKPLQNNNLISRNKLLEKKTRMTEYDETGCGVHVFVVREEDVQNAPAVDAVPVVRCRDCRWRYSSACPIRNPVDDGFCYGGETEEAWNRRANDGK